MEYENPDIPEGINVSRENHLKEFAVLVGGAIALILAVVLILGWLAKSIATQIPFSYEQEIAGNFGNATPDDPTQAAIEHELQILVDKLASHMQLPSDMTIRVHYVDDADTVNAFATLGGKVMIFRGLLAQMPNENALAMVLAHEIAHVQHRDPIVSLGRGVVVGLALAAIVGVSGSDLTSNVLGSAGALTALKFSRNMERTADASAVAALAAVYGHTNGVTLVFDLFTLLEADHPLKPPEFMASHPNSSGRLENIAIQLREHHWPTMGKLTPLSKVLQLSP